MSELQEAIQKSHNTTVRPDDVYYEFLRHLPPKSLNYLLSAFNEIWQNGSCPESWKMATIIPRPKPGKNNLYASNYHPIALTSCLWNTGQQEARLVHRIQQPFYQHPLRFQKLNINNGSYRQRLETSIREAIIQKQHLLAIFFDLEKAYETTWRYGIMNDLLNMGLKGRLPNIIKSFLSDRKFRVCIGTTLSDIQNQEGIPQGSILLVTLFNIKINSITNCLNPGIDKYLFVDDFCITSSSKYICTAEHQLQLGIYKINK